MSGSGQHLYGAEGAAAGCCSTSCIFLSFTFHSFAIVPLYSNVSSRVVFSSLTWQAGERVVAMVFTGLAAFHRPVCVCDSEYVCICMYVHRSGITL